MCLSIEKFDFSHLFSSKIYAKSRINYSTFLTQPAKTRASGVVQNDSKESLQASIVVLEKEVKNEEMEHPDPEKVREQLLKLNRGTYRGSMSDIEPLALKKKKLLEQKEKYLELTTKEHEAAKKLKEIVSNRQKYLMGPVYEGVICKACQLVVGGLKEATQKEVTNTDINTIADVGGKLCKQRDFEIQYGRVVNDVCVTMTSHDQYKGLLFGPFEREVDFDGDTEFDFSADSMLSKMQAVCRFLSLPDASL